MPARILKQIRKLKLDSLPNPRHIWKQNSQLDHVLPNLETLEVWRCDGLISLGSSSVSFQNLTTLDVWQCKGIVTLITFSAARNLVQLVKMRIRECIMLTGIVSNWGDGSETEIIFSKLKCLELHYVPNLKSFCSGKYAFQFPSLEKIIVRQCPKLKIFCQGVLSTPELHKVQLAEEDYKGFWAGDLNTTIYQLHENLVRYYEPEYLKLHEFPELQEIWNKIPQGIMDFKRLKFLELYNCNNLSYIITAPMTLELVQLQQIKVKDCKAIKESSKMREQLQRRSYALSLTQ
ncbi:Phosphoprotein phosphatase, putative [Theobroma cacao]|uniref:Phosphoprotein phosphatase, putative n=1 Tax=Theobroma cacao TaxID=3641 RepID=A0A061DU13_THECC|nr:Phosphoprotein phosphatase, putative [Theobroma cacao]